MSEDSKQPPLRIGTIGITEAAKLAHCHPDTLRKMAAARQVPATKIGRAWVFSAALFQEWIDARCRSPATVSGSGRATGPTLAERLAAKRLAKERAKRQA